MHNTFYILFKFQTVKSPPSPPPPPRCQGNVQIALSRGLSPLRAEMGRTASSLGRPARVARRRSILLSVSYLHFHLSLSSYPQLRLPQEGKGCNREENSKKIEAKELSGLCYFIYISRLNSPEKNFFLKNVVSRTSVQVPTRFSSQQW